MGRGQKRTGQRRGGEWFPANGVLEADPAPKVSVQQREAQ